MWPHSKNASFYLEFVILKTKCIISQQETSGYDEWYKICSNKLSLFNMVWLFHFLFSTIKMYSFVYSCCAGGKMSALCAWEIHHMITWRKLKWYSVIRWMECWAIIQEIWLANVHGSNSLDIPFLVRSCTTLRDVEKIPLSKEPPWEVNANQCSSSCSCAG